MERAGLRKLVLDTGFAHERGANIFLCDPEMDRAGRARRDTQMLMQGMPMADGEGWLCVATGGTGGTVRFARHDEKTLSAAVGGFCSHFGVERVNALDVLPGFHVSGLMARVRCFATGGEHVGWTWKQLEAGDWPELPERDNGWFLSLVPTQLRRLLAQAGAVARLRSFRAVFIGGGPLWPELAERAAKEKLPLVISYGMTETAAMAVAQQPGDFSGGDRSCGRPMSHAVVEILDEASGALLPAGKTGLVRIGGESVYRGFWPAARDKRFVLTEDLGRFDEAGRLCILGRRDAVIITGGKKVYPAEVENVLQATGEFSDLAVIGLPDPEWGSAVVACHPVCGRKVDAGKIDQALAGLASYKRPKRFVLIDPWPRNAQGKLNRAALIAAALAQPA